MDNLPPMKSPTNFDRALEVFVRTAPWAKTLDEATLQRVVAQCRAKSYAEGTLICQRGEWVRFWFGVMEGMVQLSTDTASGKTSILAGITAGSWFGEGSMLKQEKRKFDAIALRPSIVAQMPQKTFDELLANNLHFNRFLLLQLNERLGQFIGALESERLLDDTGRVARALSQLFNPVLYPQAQPTLQVSQNELALLIGLSRQKVNQVLQSLQTMGIVDVGYRQITILQLAKLKLLANRGVE